REAFRDLAIRGSLMDQCLSAGVPHHLLDDPGLVLRRPELPATAGAGMHDEKWPRSSTQLGQRLDRPITPAVWHLGGSKIGAARSVDRVQQVLPDGRAARVVR